MRFFLDRNLTIKKRRMIDSYRSAYSATFSIWPCCQQESSPEKKSFYAGLYGQAYDVYTEIDCEAMAGDQIVISDVVYDVADIKEMDFGAHQYKLLIVTKGK